VNSKYKEHQVWHQKIKPSLQLEYVCLVSLIPKAAKWKKITRWKCCEVSLQGCVRWTTGSFYSKHLIGAVSFLRASLWKSWAFVAYGAVSSWRWKFGRSIRSLVFFFFIVVVVFSFFLFTSVRGLESECSLVFVGPRFMSFI
jgi:hypothetical protein